MSLREAQQQILYGRTTMLSWIEREFALLQALPHWRGRRDPQPCVQQLSFSLDSRLVP
jgi:hypothetical protein